MQGTGSPATCMDVNISYSRTLTSRSDGNIRTVLSNFGSGALVVSMICSLNDEAIYEEFNCLRVQGVQVGLLTEADAMHNQVNSSGFYVHGRSCSSYRRIMEAYKLSNMRSCISFCWQAPHIFRYDRTYHF